MASGLTASVAYVLLLLAERYANMHFQKFLDWAEPSESHEAVGKLYFFDVDHIERISMR